MTVSASSYSSTDSGKSLARLLKDGATYPRISAYLDGLSAADRLEQMLSIKGFAVGKLYRAVADGPAIGHDDFLPEGTKDGEMVIFEGRNSLPAFSRFQKRFVRRGEDIVGYNHQVVAPITGPGFFVLAPSDDFRPKEVLFDYCQKPPFFPEMYPPFKPNDVGLSRLVYANMKDYCRRVAKNVVVGAAFKHGKAQHAYFSLTLPLPTARTDGREAFFAPSARFGTRVSGITGGRHECRASNDRPVRRMKAGTAETDSWGGNFPTARTLP